MRAVVQRVSRARVTVGDNIVGEIGKGFVVFLGISREDTEKDADYLAKKIVNLRVFEDSNEKMNLSLADVGGSLLIVSQFTLYGDCRKGNRPSFDKAQKPQEAKILYENFVQKCRETGLRVETGEFQAMMNVEINNDGPVTLLLDSNREF